MGERVACEGGELTIFEKKTYRQEVRRKGGKVPLGGVRELWCSGAGEHSLTTKLKEGKEKK